MSKILIVTNHSYMLYRFRLELIQSLMAEHEVVLSMPFVGHEDDFKALGLRCIETDVDRRGINPKTDFKLFRTYWKILKTEKPDMVITYSIKPNIYMGLACAMTGTPYCSNVQGLGTAFQRKGLAAFVTALYKLAFCRVKTVFFENEGNASEFVQRNILKREKITVLHGAGINLEKYPCCTYPNNEKLRFLYLGRIMREKGIDELFCAVQRLPAGQFVLDMVGFFEDEYKQQVEELEAKGIVKFHGFQSDPHPYYENADCVVLPSYHEGMSNVLLEAAAVGRPVITSDIPGCREAVEPEVSGLLCRVQDADSLYEQMAQMLDFSKEQRTQMGLAGRRRMELEFAKERVVAQTIQAIFGK